MLLLEAVVAAEVVGVVVGGEGEAVVVVETVVAGAAVVVSTAGQGTNTKTEGESKKRHHPNDRVIQTYRHLDKHFLIFFSWAGENTAEYSTVMPGQVFYTQTKDGRETDPRYRDWWPITCHSFVRT